MPCTSSSSTAEGVLAAFAQFDNDVRSVVYNLTRFAREKYDHFALRALLKSLGISLRSATEPIDLPLCVRQYFSIAWS